jgi:hypothetical protein
MDMNTRSHSFPIRHLVRDHLGREILREEYFFAEGSQRRVSTESAQKTKTVKVPANALEHVKETLITWQPTLNFGWLAPRYREIQVQFDYATNHTYYNVMPVDRPPYGEEVLRMVEMSRGLNLRSVVKPIDWLAGEPPTQEEIKSAEKEIYELRYSDRFRFYMDPRR